VAAFFYGREDIIPEMFSRLQKTLPGMKHDKNRLRHFIYYIERHHRAQCQSLAAQDVVITRPRSRGEMAADFYWAAVCLTRSETDKTGCRLLWLRTTRRFAGKRRGLSLAFLKSLVPKPPNSADRSSDGLHFRFGLHAARIARRVLNVPFQSSIRAWMLLQAARRARSFLCGESATRLSSSSLPIGP
jgi:hypothetical protein